MDFSSFWGRIGNDPLMMSAVFLTLGVILVNGWTDAPNAIATCVTTRCLSVRVAVLMAAGANFLGVILMTGLNATVAETVMRLVDFGEEPREAAVALCAAMVAIILWGTLAWAFGIPTSESHALIAGLTGSAVALHGSLGGVDGGEWNKVILGLFLSVILGFALGWLACRCVMLGFRRMSRRRSQHFFRGAQIVGAAAMAFMHGAQDGQKFLGVLLLFGFLSEGLSPVAVVPPLWMMLLCSAVMALGTALGGKKIIRSVGMEMVRLEKHQGFAADASAACSLLLCSLLSLPVSTTHVKTASIMGVGATGGLRAIKLSVVREMALTWICTFPGCTLVGFLMTKLFLLVF